MRSNRLVFPKEEGQFNSRVMVRHWADDRQAFERVYPPQYESVTKQDFGIPQPSLPTEDEFQRKMFLKCQGQKHRSLFVHADEAYMKNNITTYDQDFHQLPKLEIDGFRKKCMKPWQLENKLKTTKLFEPHIESSVKAQMDETPGYAVETYRSKEYRSETYSSFRPLPKEALLKETQRHATPRALSVDFFKPNIPAKQYPIFEKGYPTFAVPEYTGPPPQLTKPMIVADKVDTMAMRPVLSSRVVKHEGM